MLLSLQFFPHNFSYHKILIVTDFLLKLFISNPIAVNSAHWSADLQFHYYCAVTLNANLLSVFGNTSDFVLSSVT